MALSRWSQASLQVERAGLVVDDYLAAVSVAAHRCRLPSIRHLVRLGLPLQEQLLCFR